MARKSRKNLDLSDAACAKPARVNYNAAAYVRLSCDDTKKRGDSLETQRSIIENFVAASPDIQVAQVYTDNNSTGTNFSRPAFQTMLMDAECGRINCIIVKDLTRFGRNAIDAGYYLEKYLPSLGVRFIAVTDSYDSNDGDGGIMLPLKNIISESYALDISRKCRAVQRQNIKEGRFVGRMAPYGFSKSPDDCHKLVIDEKTAPVVRQIFAWAANGVGAGEITRRINDAGIIPPSHYKQSQGLIQNEKLIGTQYWKRRNITDILADRVYVGDMVQGKSRKVNHKEISVDPSEWVCVPNTHEPIITSEVFAQAEALRHLNTEQDQASRREAIPYSESVFKGKIMCAKCGHAMIRKRQNKDGIYWYRCESQHRYSKDACVQVSVKESDIKTEIIAMLHKHSEVIHGRYVSLEKTEIAPNSGSIEMELREINTGLDKDGRMLKSLYESMISGLITSDEFVCMKADYEAKIQALSQRADEIREIKRKTEAINTEFCSFAEAVAAAISNDRLTAEIIDRLVEKIFVYPDKNFDVIFRFSDEFKEVRYCA